MLSRGKYSPVTLKVATGAPKTTKTGTPGMLWFKIHHGFNSDPKFGFIANSLKISRAVLNAIILDILEYASKHDERGSIEGYDEESSAYNLGISAKVISNALQSLRYKGFVTDNKITHWEMYQSPVDKTNAERQARFRELKKQRLAEEQNAVTERNALYNTDKIREDKKVKEKNTKKENIHPEVFLKFWEAYPRQRRGNKDKAFQAWSNACERAKPEEILSGLNAYARSDEVAKGFAKGAQAWLNDDRWTWYISTPEDKAPPKEILATDLGHEGENLMKVFDALRKTHGNAVFQSWMSTIRIKNVDSSKAIITFPTKFMKEWVESHYKDDVNNAFCKVWPDLSEIDMIVEGRI
jgi:hypothetical protein